MMATTESSSERASKSGGTLDESLPGSAVSFAGTATSPTVIDATRRWLERAVIGLNLCPFAKAVHRRRQIRYVVSSATDRETLAVELTAELLHLQTTSAETVDTTLLIHPLVLTDFYDYNAFLTSANRIVERLGLDGELQVASFHPQYEFADCQADAVDNNTNRSPWPMLHLLREASITKAVAAFPDADDIYLRNIDTMRALGPAGWLALDVGANSQPHPGALPATDATDAPDAA